MNGTYQSVLLIKPSALGDIVMSLPALSALRRACPESQISWLIRPEFAPLIEGHPHLDEIIFFDRRRLGKAWHNPAAARDLVSLMRGLRRRRFDAVLDLQGLFRSASLAWLSGCKRRFGPAWEREFARHFYTSSVPPRLEWVHVVDYSMKLVEAMGISDRRVEFVLPEKLAAAAAARDLLSARDVKPERYAVLIPGSAQLSKCWPPERFAALADRLVVEHNLAVVATGSQAESPVIERIQALAEQPVVNLAGCTSLPELVELVRAAALVVSNDTGPGHIAAALGRPLVMMFSWSNPLRVGPYGRPECIVARDVESRGLARKSKDPSHAIDRITLEEVCTRAAQQLTGSVVG
jgi:lipopolysaccharide heptosyltransferase I